MAFFEDTTQYDNANNYANQAQSAYGTLGKKLGEQDDYLQRIARGEESISARQLKDALGRNLSTQRSMAASCSVNDQSSGMRHALG